MPVASATSSMRVESKPRVANAVAAKGRRSAMASGTGRMLG